MTEIPSEPIQNTNTEIGNYLDNILNYYNHELLDTPLKTRCLIVLNPKVGKDGLFIPKKWTDGDSGSIHEIQVNPKCLEQEIVLHSVIARNLIFAWQFENSNFTRVAYLNAEGVKLMEDAGLPPTSTGEPGGDKIGQGKTYYIAKEGKFAGLFNSYKGITCKYKPAPKNERLSKAKVYGSKYKCECGNYADSKSGSSYICGICKINKNKEVFMKEEKKEKPISKPVKIL